MTTDEVIVQPGHHIVHRSIEIGGFLRVIHVDDHLATILFEIQDLLKRDAIGRLVLRQKRLGSVSEAQGLAA